MLAIWTQQNFVATINKDATLGPLQQKRNTSFVRTNCAIFPHRVGSHALKTKPYFITGKAGNAKPVATTDYCGSLSPRLTLLPDVGCRNAPHDRLPRNFGAAWVFHFVSEPASCFHSALLCDMLSVKACGRCFFVLFFPDSYFLGLYSVDKVFFWVSYAPQKTSQVCAEMPATVTAWKHRAFILAFLIGTTGP